mgnify:CR=1 FL=1
MGRNDWILLAGGICNGDSHGVEDEKFSEFLEKCICDGDSHGVEDEKFREFLEKSICNKDFQGLKIQFIRRKYLQV